ncbi:hypothetical protein, partial [Aquidulcibacter sp.]|uniref:hypothetical protein n=1 Tax=Aquidulcibacter sp. TaxID=2052990 RepID=UPI0025BFDE1A
GLRLLEFEAGSVEVLNGGHGANIGVDTDHCDLLAFSNWFDFKSRVAETGAMALLVRNFAQPMGADSRPQAHRHGVGVVKLSKARIQRGCGVSRG